LFAPLSTLCVAAQTPRGSSCTLLVVILPTDQVEPADNFA